MKTKKFLLGLFIVITLLSGCKPNKSADNYIQDIEKPVVGEPENELDAFYQNTVLNGYRDIRELEPDYSREQAQTDLCFVVNAMVHNEYLYEDFMSSYKSGKDAFIRVAQSENDGQSLVITDILFDGECVKIVSNTTRNKTLQEAERCIILSSYEYITEYEYDGHLYWVAYNGVLDGSPYKNENIYVIALIN